MRLWSLHPRYLDTKGLLGVWREGLLAQKVLLGKTKRYKNHSQLIRFKDCDDSIEMIGCYLLGIYLESEARGYSFNFDKIVDCRNTGMKMDVNIGQLEYEFQHLLLKLKIRDFKKYSDVRKIKEIKAHRMFRIIDGGIADWEKIKRCQMRYL